MWLRRLTPSTATPSERVVATRWCAARLPALNGVAAFAMNKDLLMVIEDHFEDIRLTTLCEPVWTHLYKRNFMGSRQKLFAYFFGKQVCVFRFGQSRFKFCNTFDVPHEQDALYYLLFVWRQLGMSVEKDELHLVEEVTEDGCSAANCANTCAVLWPSLHRPTSATSPWLRIPTFPMTSRPSISTRKAGRASLRQRQIMVGHDSNRN